MKKEHLLKFGLIFGGGYLLFLLLKPTISKKQQFVENEKPSKPEPKPELPKTQKQFSEADLQNAEIAANAYVEALKAGEPAENLTELNKELMKEFNMRCYIDKENKLVVCDSKGNTILKK